MTKKKMMVVAREEFKMWHLPPGLVLAILWAFVYRVTEGESIEETMKAMSTNSQVTDYQI